jgi:hypothetical protein
VRLKFPSGLGVVVGAFPIGSVTACSRQPTESGVVHDHIRFGQHEISTVTRSGVRICARQVQYPATAEGGKSMGCSPSGSEFSPGGGSTEMISDGCTDANGKVLVKCVGENLLPTAQAWGLGWQGPPVSAPRTGNRHIDLPCHLSPGQALIAQLQDLLCGARIRRGAASHGDAGPLELLADRAPMNAQLGTDLAQRPTLGVQVGCTLNVHGDTVMRVSAKSFGSAWRTLRSHACNHPFRFIA